MWKTHIVEYKARPAHMGPKIHSEIGITVGIILCMYKPIFSKVKYVVVDSGFCVANGIVALAAKVVYVDDLIKKCRFLTKSVPGYLIPRNFSDK